MFSSFYYFQHLLAEDAFIYVIESETGSCYDEIALSGELRGRAGLHETEMGATLTTGGTIVIGASDNHKSTLCTALRNRVSAKCSL